MTTPRFVTTPHNTAQPLNPIHPEIVAIVMDCIKRSGYRIAGPDNDLQNAFALALFIADEIERFQASRGAE